MATHTQLGNGSVEGREWRICALPTPRNLKMGWLSWAKLFVVVLVVGIGFSTFGGYLMAFHRMLSGIVSAIFLMAFITLFVLLIFYSLFRSDISDHSLLKRGKCVVGRVISQRRIKMGRGSRSEISYSFPIGPGKPMTGRGTDWTGFYSKNMPVLVFFDTEDISKNVAYCCIAWKVRLEDGTFLEP